MEESDEILKLIDEINIRKSNPRDYKKMKSEEISMEFKNIMKFDQESFKRIEEFEKTQKNPDLIQYAKMICKNTTGREIEHIQGIYLKKIDEEFLNSK
jgi:hypothetical protein